jgi:exonuclease III
MRANYWSKWVLLALALASGLAAADDSSIQEPTVRVLSWNVSGDAFVAHPAAFAALMRQADPDVLLLDEVSPSADAGKLRKALAGVRSGDGETWHIGFGRSGGRQRTVIASRAPLEALAEFGSVVPYPEADRDVILRRMSVAERLDRDLTMDEGIPVNGGVLVTAGRRLLLVIADLQSRGNDPGSWQEFRRQVEVREIRRLVRQVLDRLPVDGVVLAGDINLVSTALPLVILTGPYPRPHSGLIPVELYHRDGATSWTWDGRGTPFPSKPIDFQLYDSQALRVREGFILDTEDLPAEELERFGLETETSSRLSDHRPLVVEYAWH